MNVKKIDDLLLVLEFNSKVEMNRVMWRVTEFCEGPSSLMGRKFHFDDFIDEYIEFDGVLGYFSFWEGHNFPKHKLIKFMYAFSGDLTTREKNLLNVSNLIEDDGYIIAYVKGDDMTFKHEMAHALFFNNLDYATECINALKNIPKDVFEKYRNALKDLNYNDEVIDDEMQAYLVAYDKDEWDKLFPEVDITRMDNIQFFLQKTGQKYMKL